LTFEAWRERSAYLMPPLVSNWGPSIVGWTCARIILIFIAALLSGLVVKRSYLATSTPSPFGISWKVWLWLWLPLFFWLHPLPSNLYFIWLNLALDWHHGFHASLWFDWKWDLFEFVAGVFAFAALLALLAGVYRGLCAVSSAFSESEDGKARLREFLVFGIGLAIVANFAMLTLTVWALNHILVISDSGRPWWQFF
jgi:hypothetical protein